MAQMVFKAVSAKKHVMLQTVELSVCKLRIAITYKATSTNLAGFIILLPLIILVEHFLCKSLVVLGRLSNSGKLS